MNGQIERLTSLNHKIDKIILNNGSNATVTLSPDENRNLAPTKDFILYLRDSTTNVPTGISSLSKDKTE